MSALTPLFDAKAKGRPLRLAAFMSGSGTNIRRLLERKSPHYEIAFIFSDVASDKCQGQNIAREYGLPYFAYDTRRFHELKGVKRTVTTPEGLAARREYDRVAARLVAAFQVDLIALGGYMSFLTLPGGVNVHPADLSLSDAGGNRLFVGDDAVYDAILAGRKELRSSTLWIDQGVDSGPLLMVSEPLPVELPAPLAELKNDDARLRELADQHQERLKERGDWVVFPLTMELIGQGRLALDQSGLAHLDGKPRPQGVRPSEI
ncbi:formyl transferase [Desulfocarbo indianensis]|nr:formyl transferase [Desulfocarbo indianensis]